MVSKPVEGLEVIGSHYTLKMINNKMINNRYAVSGRVLKSITVPPVAYDELF